jgi:hypothetical protein
MMRAVDVRADAALLATIACHGLRPADDHAAGAPGDAPGLTPAQQDALQDVRTWPIWPACTRQGICWQQALCLTATQPVRGLPILPAGVAEARALMEADPAIRASKYRIIALPWMVPARAMAFSPATFPRSAAEAARP